MPIVSVFMDVEDPLNPLADDAALDVARLFAEAGVRGSFCLTGEKCRTLLARGRRDVLKAYASHSLGLHTDTHSYHPTTMELLADCTYEEGCELALDAESKGLAAFERALGKLPSFWGGAGNTWSPEIAFAIRELEIPAYSYALTAVPNHAVHRFNGAIALPQTFSISEVDWADDQRASVRSAEVLDALAKSETGWIGVFVGHPTKLRYTQFWDFPYAGGRQPANPELAEPHPTEVYERSLLNLSRFLGRLDESFEINGVDEALALSWQFRAPSVVEREFFMETTARNLRGAAMWPIHRPDLDPEKIVGKTLQLVDTLEIAELSPP